MAVELQVLCNWTWENTNVEVGFIHEPDLEFGNGGKHVDVRAGLLSHGPMDLGLDSAPTHLRLGIVGTRQSIDEVRAWLEKCESTIEGGEARRANLRPSFPGFNPNDCFRSTISIHDRWLGIVTAKEIESVCTAKVGERIGKAADLFLEAARHIGESGGPMVILCVPPHDLFEAVDSVKEDKDMHEEGLDEGSDPDFLPPRDYSEFHDVLKAKAMTLNTPIQLARPPTYGGTRGKKTKSTTQQRSLQDEATRAWNFYTALYYKAGGVPWRLVRTSSEFTTCYVGISFYRSLDRERLHASAAQVFNERGEGVVIRGGLATYHREDRQIHLDDDNASKLMSDCIEAYRREHRTTPARLVVHKTSPMNQIETAAFRSVADSYRIDLVELVSLRRSFTRLFRIGSYPPLRGTYLTLSQSNGLVYLRGSVSHFRCYPGMYVPRPIEFVRHQGEDSIRAMASELMSLSKLNWNNTQFDGGEPMTVRAARRVGDILKCLPDGSHAQASFRFFT